MMDEQLNKIQRAERVRTLFELLLEVMNLTYECSPKDVFSRMREIHEEEQEAAKFVAQVMAKGYNQPKTGKSKQIKVSPKVIDTESTGATITDLRLAEELEESNNDRVPVS